MEKKLHNSTTQILGNPIPKERLNKHRRSPRGWELAEWKDGIFYTAAALLPLS